MDKKQMSKWKIYTNHRGKYISELIKEKIYNHRWKEYTQTLLDNEHFWLVCMLGGQPSHNMRLMRSKWGRRRQGNINKGPGEKGQGKARGIYMPKWCPLGAQWGICLVTGSLLWSRWLLQGMCLWQKIFILRTYSEKKRCLHKDIRLSIYLT